MIINPTISIKERIVGIMAILVKWLTHWSVKPTCVGSIPTYRPIRQLVILSPIAFFYIKTLELKKGK